MELRELDPELATHLVFGRLVAQDVPIATGLLIAGLLVNHSYLNQNYSILI